MNRPLILHYSLQSSGNHECILRYLSQTPTSHNLVSSKSIAGFRPQACPDVLYNQSPLRSTWIRFSAKHRQAAPDLPEHDVRPRIQYPAAGVHAQPKPEWLLSDIRLQPLEDPCTDTSPCNFIHAGKHDVLAATTSGLSSVNRKSCVFLIARATFLRDLAASCYCLTGSTTVIRGLICSLHRQVSRTSGS